MDVQIFIDVARYAHILAVAVGFGAAFLTDLHVLSRLGNPIDQGFITALHAFHTVIWRSVFAMWITGLIMIYIRTGFEPANFSPKLIAKLLTVGILTINAQVIAKVVMPLIEDNRGQSLMWLPLGSKLWLAAIGAVSTSSWMMALAMGSSKVLAAGGWVTFAICIPIVYFGALAVASAVMWLLHLGAQMAPRQLHEPKLNVVRSERHAPVAAGAGR